MERFQSILAEATQLKQAQLKSQRKKYQSLPQFLKSGLAYSKKYIRLRKQNYYIQHYVASKLKNQGNSLFQSKQYSDALNKYQQALSIFRFINASTTQNLKDEHLNYQNYSPHPQHLQLHTTLTQAIYLNISSCLTKLNRKQEAIRSADQSLIISESAKGHYKKAHAYLDYINRNNQDIKLGFYELNKAYLLSNDKAIVEQMHRIKDEIDKQKEKQKQWFKFMFHQGKKQQKTTQLKEQKNIMVNPEKTIESEQKKTNINHKMENQFNQFLEQVIKVQKTNQNNQNILDISYKNNDKTKIQKTKQKLIKYVHMPNQIWETLYQREFIEKHGSKIYSILQIYNYKEQAQQYRSVLGQCLDFKDQRNIKTQHPYQSYIKWLKGHPFEKIKKYIERYEMQTQWIIEKRKEKIKEDEKRLQLQQKKQTIDKKIDFWRSIKIISVIFLIILVWKMI